MYSKITPAGISLLLTLCFTSLSATEPPAVGDAFPVPKPADIEGTFPKTEGKILLVDFWASWCGPCRLAVPELNKIHQEYSAKGVVLVGISVDDRAEDMQKFLSRQPIDFNVVRDAKKSLAAHMRLPAMPTTYLVDRNGKIRFIHSGYHGQKTADSLREQLNLLLQESDK